MSVQRCLRKNLRLFAAIAALCYFWVGAALSFQHSDSAAHDLEPFLRLPTLSVGKNIPIPLRTRVSSAKATAQTTHCFACEWQTNNVSPALPAFTFAKVHLVRTCVLTTFPRYLRVRTFPTPSRAPPLA